MAGTLTSLFLEDPAFIRTQSSKPRHLLETRRLFGSRRLIEVFLP